MGSLGQPRYIDPIYRKRPPYEARRYKRREMPVLVYRPHQYKSHSYEERIYIPRKYHPPPGRKAGSEQTIMAKEEK